MKIVQIIWSKEHQKNIDTTTTRCRALDKIKVSLVIPKNDEKSCISVSNACEVLSGGKSGSRVNETEAIKRKSMEEIIIIYLRFII